MASPELQIAIKKGKELLEKNLQTVEEFRVAFDQAWSYPLQADVKFEPLTVAGMKAAWSVAPNAAADRVVLYLHGGGYIIGSLKSHRDIMGRIARAAAARVLGLDYRLAPEHPFPAAVEDSVAAYRWLLDQGVKPSRIALAGDSAGGGLVVCALLAFREAKLPMPAAGVCLSPWTDLAAEGESIRTRAQADPFVKQEMLTGMVTQYLGNRDPHTPLASPIYGDLQGLPPLLIQVGDAEILLSDATRLADRAKTAGVDAEIEVWPEMFHVFQSAASFLPEGAQAIDTIGSYLRKRIP